MLKKNKKAGKVQDTIIIAITCNKDDKIIFILIYTFCKPHLVTSAPRSVPSCKFYRAEPVYCDEQH